MKGTSKDVLSRCRLFKGLADSSLSELARICEVRTYPRGDQIFAQGEPAEGFYVVLKGRVKVYKISKQGREQILHILSDNQMFAEAAAFADGVYPAFAETLAKSELAFFPASKFADLIARDPRLALNMIAVLSNLLREFTVLVEDLSLREVASRVARRLIERAREEHVLTDRGVTVTLTMTKAQLASSVGTVAETLSRTLANLESKGLISVKRNAIEITNLTGLNELAEE